MGFIALIFALLIEQGRPLPEDNLVHRGFVRLADALMRTTNAGEARHGAIGWSIVVIGSLGALALSSWAADALHPLALLCLHVVVLYHTVGFRQFSHAFTSIQVALASGDIAAARSTLQGWLRRDDPGEVVGDAPVPEICRLAIAHALVASHRHVFAPLFWYILLPGPVGPVLYRLAEMLSRRWFRPGEAYGEFALTAYRALDWLPLRLSAAGFAIVGNFEDAVYAWRGLVASGAPTDQRALLLATGGGALGLRIADPAMIARWAQDGERGFEPPGDEPGSDGLLSAVGLVWRSVVLWIALFAMLTVANWLGR